MTNHIKFGISKGEWIGKSIDEARTDPVGLWQIVKNGRHGFGLTGGELEAFVTDHIVALMRSGAQPVTGDKDSPSGWRLATNADADPHKFAESLIEQWTRARVDPDVDNVWFAFPTAWMC